MTTHHTPTPAPDERPPEKPLASDSFSTCCWTRCPSANARANKARQPELRHPRPDAPRLAGMRQAQPAPAEPELVNRSPLQSPRTPSRANRAGRPQPGEPGWQPPAPAPSSAWGAPSGARCWQRCC